MKTNLLLRAALGLSLTLGATHCASGGGGSPSSDGNGNGDGTSNGNANGTGDTGNLDGGSTRKLDGSTTTPPKTDGGVSDGGSPITIKDSGTPGKNDSGASDSGSNNVADAGPVHTGTYQDLSVQPSTAFDKSKPDTHPTAGYTPPAGWQWYNIAGATCRDGKSPFGVMVHWASTDANKLFIYFEGGGACPNPGFCNLNPADVGHMFFDKGQAAIYSLGLQATPQDPGADGIFNFNEAANPYKDYNFIYIPYCTGDVHFGGNPNGKINGVDGVQNFSGAANSKAVVARALATFPNTTRFIAGGSSAGGYGAGLNYGMIQDSFKNAEGSAILDASPPFNNEYSPVCLQKRWREAWNLDANIPSDCGETCKTPDGGNLFNIVNYWRGKYPKAHIALISGIHDEIIRLFFSMGNNNCANYDSFDPVGQFIGTIGQTYDPAMFAAGLMQLRTDYVSTGQLSTYYEGNPPNDTIHQILFDPRLYQDAAGTGMGTVADFLTKFNADTMSQVGP